MVRGLSIIASIARIITEDCAVETFCNNWPLLDVTLTLNTKDVIMKLTHFPGRSPTPS